MHDAVSNSKIIKSAVTKQFCRAPIIPLSVCPYAAAAGAPRTTAMVKRRRS